MTTTTIKLATDFDACPSGRYRLESETSGERFRDDFVKPGLAHGGCVIIDLNDADSLPPSFLDEAIGKLAGEMGLADYRNRVTVLLSDDATALRKLNESIDLRTLGGKSKECAPA